MFVNLSITSELIEERLSESSLLQHSYSINCLGSFTIPWKEITFNNGALNTQPSYLLFWLGVVII